MNAIKKVLSNPLVWITVGYLLFPVDFVADAVPVAGTADDLVLFLITYLIQELMNNGNNNGNNNYNNNNRTN